MALFIIIIIVIFLSKHYSKALFKIFLSIPIKFWAKQVKSWHTWFLFFSLEDPLDIYFSFSKLMELGGQRSLEGLRLFRDIDSQAPLPPRPLTGQYMHIHSVPLSVSGMENVMSTVG